MNMREQAIQLLLNIPDGMRIGIFIDETTFLPICIEHSDIEAVENENGQMESALVLRSCCQHDLPVNKKNVNLN